MDERAMRELAFIFLYDILIWISRSGSLCCFVADFTRSNKSEMWREILEKQIQFISNNHHAVIAIRQRSVSKFTLLNIFHRSFVHLMGSRARFHSLQFFYYLYAELKYKIQWARWVEQCWSIFWIP